jgi:hypothetical protein
VQGTLRVGLEIGARWFRYSDPLWTATNLRPYDVAFVPLVVLGGELRPFVWTGLPVLRSVGVVGAYAFAPHLGSSTRDGRSFDTTWERGDIVLRVPVLDATAPGQPELAVDVGYGWLGFSFQDAGDLADQLPSVGYRSARLGLDGKIPLRPGLMLRAGFSYLITPSGGEVYARFRDAHVAGVRADLGLDVTVAKGAAVEIGLGYTRFYSSFAPVPGDAYVAGGALDQFLGLQIGFAYAP